MTYCDSPDNWQMALLTTWHIDRDKRWRYIWRWLDWLQWLRHKLKTKNITTTCFWLTQTSISASLTTRLIFTCANVDVWNTDMTNRSRASATPTRKICYASTYRKLSNILFSNIAQSLLAAVASSYHKHEPTRHMTTLFLVLTATDWVVETGNTGSYTPVSPSRVISIQLGVNHCGLTYDSCIYIYCYYL